MIPLKFTGAVFLAVVLISAATLLYLRPVPGTFSEDQELPLKINISSSRNGSNISMCDIGLDANISSTEVELGEYISRGCFPAVTISIRSNNNGTLKIWREPSKLEYPLFTFDLDDLSSGRAAIRDKLAMRQFIRLMKLEFADKYGSRNLLISTPMTGGRMYRFIISPPDIPIFESLRLNITDDACRKVAAAIPNGETWEWTYNYTVMLTSNGSSKETGLSVRYRW